MQVKSAYTRGFAEAPVHRASARRREGGGRRAEGEAAALEDGARRAGRKIEGAAGRGQGATKTRRKSGPLFMEMGKNLYYCPGAVILMKVRQIKESFWQKPNRFLPGVFIKG